MPLEGERSPPCCSATRHGGQVVSPDGRFSLAENESAWRGVRHALPGPGRKWQVSSRAEPTRAGALTGVSCLSGARRRDGRRNRAARASVGSEMVLLTRLSVTTNTCSGRRPTRSASSGRDDRETSPRCLRSSWLQARVSD
jgi:hypothetical protein